jgi:hypothetical protein
MLNLVLRLLGHRALHQAASHPTARRALDWRLGLRLLRDRRVPLKTKTLALGLGAMALVAVEIFEMPLELFVAAVLPLIGIAADFAIDGLELVAVPMLVATLVLPHLAPRAVVEQVRHEMAGSQNVADSGHVYEAAATAR